MSAPREIRPRSPATGSPDGERDDRSSWDAGLRVGSFEVDVAPLGRRRRLPDRAIVGAVLAAVLVALAVVKPWESGPADLPPTAIDASPTASPAASPSPTSPAIEFDETNALAALTWPTLAIGMPERDDWGLRVLTNPAESIVEVPSTGRDPLGNVASDASLIPLGEAGAVVERWYPVRGTWPGRRQLWQTRAGLGGALMIPPPDAPIRLLALTSPRTDAPLDVRIWRITVGGFERLDVGRPAGDLGIGDWYLAPPTVDGVRLAAWPAGWFRIDILTADGITRLALRIDRGPATPDLWPPPAPAPDPPMSRSDLAPEPRDRGPDRAPLEPEAFMILGPEAVGLAVRLGDALDERGIWLAAAAREGPDEVPRVATIRVPSAAGFGVRFPDGSLEPRLSLVSMIGLSRPREATRTGVHAGPAGGSPWAVVDAPSGRSWPPGVYRIDATWLEPSGERREASYHVDLLAGRVPPTPALLSATRAWARHVDGSGIVSGMVEPLRAPPPDAVIRLADQQAVATPTDAAGLDPDCRTGAGLAGTRRPIGVVTSSVDPVAEVEVVAVAAYAQPRQVEVRSAVEPFPGLVVVAPESAAGWESGRYAISLEGDAGSVTYGFCVE